jgi:hypothetical protein
LSRTSKIEYVVFRDHGLRIVTLKIAATTAATTVLAIPAPAPPTPATAALFIPVTALIVAALIVAALIVAALIVALLGFTGLWLAVPAVAAVVLPTVARPIASFPLAGTALRRPLVCAILFIGAVRFALTVTAFGWGANLLADLIGAVGAVIGLDGVPPDTFRRTDCCADLTSIGRRNCVLPLDRL